MKMAPLLRAFDAHPRLRENLLVHTGQHYDPVLSDDLFCELCLRAPDLNLGVGSGSHAVQTAEVMKKIDAVMDEVLPAGVVVVGDVNSTLACSLVAAKRGSAVIHVEAGLRSFDRAMPEEINRLLTDRISDVLYTTEESATSNLLNEGIEPNRIVEVGNVMIDSLMHALPRATPARQTLRSVFCAEPEAGFALVTLHRPSNVDDRDALAASIDLLVHVSQALPVVWPMHPRTASRIDQFGLRGRLAAGRIHVSGALGYLALLGLIRDARVVLTDSGGLQEETTAVGVPCLTLRDSTERPVTVLEGTNTVIGRDFDKALDCIDEILLNGGKRGRRPRFWDGRAAERIAQDLAWRLDNALEGSRRPAVSVECARGASASVHAGSEVVT